MKQLSAFEQEALRLAFRNMFRADKYLSICTIDEAVKMTGAVIPQRTYDALRLLHCVSWSSMTQKMREETAKTVLGLFQEDSILDLPSLDESFLPDDLRPVKVPSLFSKLLTKVAS